MRLVEVGVLRLFLEERRAWAESGAVLDWAWNQTFVVQRVGGL